MLSFFPPSRPKGVMPLSTLFYGGGKGFSPFTLKGGGWEKIKFGVGVKIPLLDLPRIYEVKLGVLKGH